MWWTVPVICTENTKYQQWIGESIEISREWTGTRSLRPFSHLEQRPGDATRQQEAWPTYQTQILAPPPKHQLLKRRQTCHLVTLLKTETAAKHVKVRQAKTKPLSLLKTNRQTSSCRFCSVSLGKWSKAHSSQPRAKFLRLLLCDCWARGRKSAVSVVNQPGSMERQLMARLHETSWICLLGLTTLILGNIHRPESNLSLFQLFEMSCKY